MNGAPWILATRNAGKLRELRALFADVGLDVIDLTQAGIAERPEEEAIEIHDTFDANALAKARYYAARAPGRTVVADDSGLEVLALDGAPGVKSKRWSGRDDLSGVALDASNNALLLERLANDADRRARFVCAAAWCDGARSEVALGEVRGEIVARGAGSEGFGYDPHFFATELGMTLGEATVAEKQRVSHRARAFAALLERLHTRGVVSSAVSASVRTRVAGGS